MQRLLLGGLLALFALSPLSGVRADEDSWLSGPWAATNNNCLYYFEIPTVEMVTCDQEHRVIHKATFSADGDAITITWDNGETYVATRIDSTHIKIANQLTGDIIELEKT